ncbi:hypothetical protein CEE67_09555 [Limosilactobacillus fermentum]|uniref:hypothetical protein n=1 Tax=Limosilactobacillus fermentum TaxID=1613 RepID=UPI000B4C5AC3|nr:hypothetical protein [Limosilactobacillus fermentum]OWP34862.1 hypothetical protein CEE67_09555 [Limosilactobacillus fermentum]
MKQTTKDNQNLVKVAEPSETLGGKSVIIQLGKRKLFKELGLAIDRKHGLWIRGDEINTICECCYGRKGACQLFRIETLGEVFICGKCQEVFGSPIINDRLLNEVISFVSALDSLSENRSRIIPENPRITKGVIKYAYAINGKSLTKRFSNNSSQIVSLFQLVRDGKAYPSQRDKAVAFVIELSRMFGYEPFQSAREAT